MSIDGGGAGRLPVVRPTQLVNSRFRNARATQCDGLGLVFRPKPLKRVGSGHVVDRAGEVGAPGRPGPRGWPPGWRR